MSGSPPRLQLWGVSTSRTLRALWALHELSLDYQVHPIRPRTGETKTEAFTRLNPRQKIPVLQDGDFTIAESPAIIAYLSDTYGTDSNRLVPVEPRLRATWLEWCFHIAMELDATSLYVMRRHRDLKHIYGDAPVAVESASQYFETQLRHVVHALDDGRHYLVGERFTSADMLLTTCLVWAIAYGVPVPPVCRDYAQRITARPAYRDALRVNVPPPTGATG
ncbi:MAG: glutathione S-transferase family protein [Reyranellaceae bacterium]